MYIMILDYFNVNLTCSLLFPKNYLDVLLELLVGNYYIFVYLVVFHFVFSLYFTQILLTVSYLV